MRTLLPLLFLCPALLPGTFAHAGTAGPEIAVESFLRPAPNAAALVKYADYPVSYATGIPEISVPIYTIRTRELEMPISLSYHAGGAKVGELATSVGLGWNLNCGGVITRVVRGLPDTSGTDIRLREQIRDSDIGYIKSFLSGLQDTDYDIYYYNVNGQSGEFLCHPVTRAITQLPETDNIITAGEAASRDEPPLYFTITTPDGVSYRFTEKEYVSTQNYRVVSSWYLSKVLSPNGTDALTLTYASDPEWRQTSAHSVVTSFNFSTPGTPPQTMLQQATSTYTQSKRLSSIEFATGSVVFLHQQDRQDQGPVSRLTAIRCNNHQEQILEATFDNDFYFPGAQPKLKLKGMKITGRGGGTIDEQRFSYMQEDSPMLAEPSYDLFGYYNGKADNALSDRSYSFDHAQYHILNRIDHITGASTRFIYQPNPLKTFTYWNDPLDLNIGIRIARIETHNASGRLYTRSYEYAGSTPTIDFSKINGSGYLASHEFGTNLVGGGLESTGLVSASVSSHSTLPGVSVESAKLIHGRVVEKRYGNTRDTVKTVYEHRLPDPNYQITNEWVPLCDWEDDSYWPTNRFFTGAQFSLPGLGTSNPFVKYFTFTFGGYFTDSGWSHGQLTKKQVYNWENNRYNLIEQTENEYQIKNFSMIPEGIYVNFTTRNRGLNTENPSPYPGNYLSDYYYFNPIRFNGRCMIVSSVVTSYFASGNIVRRTGYTYPGQLYDHIDRGVRRSETLSVNDEPVQTTNYYYPFDYTTPASTTMKARNQLLPVKTELVKDGRAISAVETRYALEGILVLPRSTLKYDQAAVADQYDILNYDQHQNPACVTRNGESKKVYIWGYNWSEPVAEIRNATYQQLLDLDSGGMIGRIGAGNNLTDNSSEMQWLQGLRSRLPDAEITLYTYIPLLGVKTITDPSGRTTRYEYDSANRLQQIKDENGNVLEAYEYHYKNR